MNFAEYRLKEDYLNAIHEHNLTLLKLEWISLQQPEELADANQNEVRKKLWEIEKQSKFYDVMKAKAEIDKLELELQKYKKE